MVLGTIGGLYGGGACGTAACVLCVAWLVCVCWWYPWVLGTLGDIAAGPIGPAAFCVCMCVWRVLCVAGLSDLCRVGFATFSPIDDDRARQLSIKLAQCGHGHFA